MSIRYIVTTYRTGEGKVRFTVQDCRHGRPVNLTWNDRLDAQAYADRLNLRGTSRIVPMGVA